MYPTKPVPVRLVLDEDGWIDLEVSEDTREELIRKYCESSGDYFHGVHFAGDVPRRFAISLDIVKYII